MGAPTITPALAVRYSQLTGPQCKALRRHRPDGTAIPVTDDHYEVIVGWLTLDALHVTDLRRMARALDVIGRSRLTKTRLMVEVMDGLDRRQRSANGFAEVAERHRQWAASATSASETDRLERQAAVYAARSARLAVP